MLYYSTMFTFPSPVVSAITFSSCISVGTYYVHQAYYVDRPLRLSSFGHCYNIRWSEQTVKLLIVLHFSPSYNMSAAPSRVLLSTLTVEAWFRSQASPCGFCCGQCGIRIGFPPITSGFSVNTIPSVLHIHSFIHPSIYCQCYLISTIESVVK